MKTTVKHHFNKNREDKRVLRRALSRMRFWGIECIAEQVVQHADLVRFDAEKTIIKQGAEDTDLYLILSGEVSIIVNDRVVAKKTRGDHVGLMALLDATAVRSATVQAIDKVVTARISEGDFLKIVSENPALFEYLLLELIDLVKQKDQRFYTHPNKRPVVFVSSSSEYLDVARGIRDTLHCDNVIVKLWDKGVFKPGEFFIDSLNKELDTVDFAVLVLGCSDKTESRGEAYLSPRDNVILELGLCMGKLSRQRTIMVVQSDMQVKIPTDLQGIHTLSFENNPGEAVTLTEVCKGIQESIMELGVR